MGTGIIANVIGATGLVGRELVRQLLETAEVRKVRIFVRRPFGLSHPKLEEVIVDFDNKASWQPLLNGDVLFSALGTTLKQAGSKEAQYKVDFTYNYEFARAAAENGVKSYVLVSSAGANPRSLIFYSRMKGELDEKVQTLPFPEITILRPSILAGEREVPRKMEEISVRVMEKISKVLFRTYRPIPAGTVARAMISAVLLKTQPGKRVVNPDELFILAAR